MSIGQQQMNIFSMLFRRAPNRVFLTILLDALSGMAFAMIIPLVLGAISSGDEGFRTIEPGAATVFGLEVSHERYALMFFATVLFILAAKTTSRILMERIASDVMASMRIELYERLVEAPVSDVERTGPGRVMAVLIEDVPWLIASGRLFPTMLSNLATLIGMLGYLAYLNTDAFVFVMQALVVGTITYQVPAMIGLRFMRRRREYADKLQRSVRALLDGFKELKLDRRKRETFLKDYLQVNEHGVRDSDKAADALVTIAGTYGDLISFFVIGIMSFVFVNYHSISGPELIAVIMTLLYITGPVASLLQVVPQYMNAGVALRHVNRLFAEMPKETAKAVYEPAITWDSVRFDEVVYNYTNSDDKKGYVVGPVSFAVKKGEITFIVGGNGSGKSTLSKLITLHYALNSGGIYFGETRIDDETLNIYRQQIAFIYSDYYLFDRLLGFGEDPQVKAAVDGYLRDLGLEHKVTFENGRFSTLHLSDGQKRRLALLVAFVEDKELYLFDEWAADQDPAFKDAFYYRLLPELKSRGKAVVVVSHDDRYFAVADNILFMENGRLVDNPELEFAKAEAALAKNESMPIDTLDVQEV